MESERAGTSQEFLGASLFGAVAALCFVPLGVAGVAVGIKMLYDVPYPMVGILLVSTGLLNLAASICVFVRRAWAYRVVAAAAIILMAAVPIGTFLGLALFFGLKRNKRMFHWATSW
jgi:hypothetical protein